ncbi:MAG: glutamine amidotransferase [Beijerinckiaceae bacterium]|nr:MAG: glutamine amidotransferase [Beijerinckiaceae bacterium]
MSQRIESRRVAVILHQEHSTPGRLGMFLRAQGFELDVRRPRYGDPLPASLSDHAGAIIFGGPMSVNDEDDWLRREIDWIKVPLKEGKPLLGICLGAQMLARYLGRKVSPHPHGRVEVGYYPIAPTEAGRGLCGSPFPERVYQWHGEGFDLPCGATLLARGEDFEAQAIRYGPSAYGFQFHPEVTYAMMCRWTVQGTERMGQPGAQPRHLHLEGWYLHDAPIARWTNAFLKQWLARAETEARQQAG